MTVVCRSRHPENLRRCRAPLLDTLTWLGQTEGTEGGGFFATHPATIDRIEALRTVR